MKYTEISLNDYVIDPNLTLYRIDETEERIDLHAKSTNHQWTCPKCNTFCDEQHSTYERSYYILPLRGKPTQVHAIVSTYECHDPDCPQLCFTEPMTTVGPYQTMIPMHGPQTSMTQKPQQGQTGRCISSRRRPVRSARWLRRSYRRRTSIMFRSTRKKNLILSQDSTSVRLPHSR